MFYTPVMLRILGQAEHGLYSLANSVVGYLSLLGFGFGSTIIRYISKYRAERDENAIRRIYGFFLVLYGTLGVLVLVGGGALAWIAPMIFAEKLSVAELLKIRILIPVLALHTALTFPLSVFNALILSYERYFYRRVMDILATIIGPCFNLIALFLGYASVGMATAALVVQILFALPNIYYCTKTLGITPVFEALPRPLIRELIGFSGYVFLASIVDTLFWATDKVIIGMLIGSAAVSVYQVGGTFNTMAMQFSSSISGVLAPKVTGMVVREASPEQLTELFIRVGRIQFLIVGLIVFGFTAFGEEFIVMWAGENYRDSYPITILTLVPLCIPLIQNTGIQILLVFMVN